MQSQPNAVAPPSTDAAKYKRDPRRRWPVKGARGISYRLNARLERSYVVFHEGGFHPAGARLEDARELQAELKRAKRRGEKLPVRQSEIPTFAALAERWYEAKSARRRTSTCGYYRSALDLVLLPRFGKAAITSVDADECARLIRDLGTEGLHALDRKRPRRPLGRSSIVNYLKPLHGVFKLAIRQGYIKSNPLDVLNDDERPRQDDRTPMHEWTSAEIRSLLEASEALAARPESRYDYTPLLRLCVTIGLRLGEALGLRWEDFSKDEGTLQVRRQWTKFGEYGPTKTSSSVRKLKLPSDLREELIALRLRSGFSQDDHPVFAARSGRPLGHRNVTQRGFEPARDLAGLPGSLTFHDLRHSCASRLLAKGEPAANVAKYLGHANPAITLSIYAHVHDPGRADDRLAAAAAL
jgi:integrase